MKNTNTERPCDIEHGARPATIQIGATVRNTLQMTSLK
jgi:hypothetical protein